MLRLLALVLALGVVHGWGRIGPMLAYGQLPNTAGYAGAVLEQGLKLEAERRWHDALVQYEQALRQLPGHADLQWRWENARIHWDIVRRSRDTSFVQLSRLRVQDALALYDEVLSKIDAYYVDNPSWQRLFSHGWRTWQAALTEPEFLAAHGWTQSPISPTVQKTLERQVQSWMVTSRRDLYAVVSECAYYLEQRAGIPGGVVVLEFTSGALLALDEYSGFLTAVQLEEVLSQIEGNFVGVGVEVKPEPGSLLVVSVIPGGPAFEGGIHAGDRIVAVQGRWLTELPSDQAADALRGPEGSVVELAVRAPDSTTRMVRLTRRRVEVPSIEQAQVIDKEAGVAYLKLASFQKSTARDIDQALWQLHRQGMRSLIIDLRGNPGGLLTAAVEAADRFLSQGPIVATRGRNAQEDYDYRAHAVGTWQIPLVVLIDQDSASASEIFAAAISDQQRGTLIGQRSYGKGSVQGIFPLQSARAGVRLTTARFYSPSGKPISRSGIAPHLSVHTAAKPTDGSRNGPTEHDAVLELAIQTARQAVQRMVAGR